MVAPNPDDFPEPKNGRVEVGDIWTLLSHPVYGMGALHSKVENINQRVVNLEGSVTQVNKEVDDLNERSPYTADQARQARADMKRSENRRAVLQRTSSSLWERGVSLVVASITGGFLLANIRQILHQIMKTFGA